MERGGIIIYGVRYHLNMEMSVSNFVYTLLIEIWDNLSLSNAGSSCKIESSRSIMVLDVVQSGG